MSFWNREEGTTMNTQTTAGKTMAMTVNAPRPARTPSLLTHVAAKHAKQAERQRLREDRLILRANR